MKKFFMGAFVGLLMTGLLSWIVIIPLTARVAVEVAERAAECTVGTAVTGPANLLIDGVELGAGLVDGAFDVGGALLDLGGGVFGFGGDDDGYRWKEEQLQIAATFISVGLSYKNHPDANKRISDRDIVSILAAGLTESEMQNLPEGTETSVGVLQLLAVHGTFAERMDLEFQARWYFDELLRLLPDSDKRETIPIGEISAIVERPAEEFRHRYADRVDEATAMFQALSPSLSGSIAIIGGSLTESNKADLIDYIRDGGWQTVLFDTAFERDVVEAAALAAEWQDEYEPTLWVFDFVDSRLLSEVGSVADANALIAQLEEPLPENANQAWVTMYDANSNVDDIWNEALAIRDARTPNFNLIPWASYVAERPEAVLANGTSFTASANRERAAMIARVALDPVSFGFDESELGSSGGGGIFNVDLPSGCELGETIFGVAKTAVGAVFDPVSAGGDFISWASSESLNIELSDDATTLLEDAEKVEPTEILPGDLIAWTDDTDDGIINPEMAIYLGGSEIIREPDPGAIVVVETIDWFEEFEVYRLKPVSPQIDGNVDIISYEDTVVVEGFRVHPDLKQPIERLMSEARADGIDLGGGAWRSVETTVEMRKSACGTSNYAIYDMPPSECSPPTANPGKSMHERGLAIDFTCDGELIVSRENRCFVWLTTNAEPLAGLKNYPVEEWHWSVNGK